MVNTITFGLPASYYTTRYRTPDGDGATSGGDASGRRVRDTVEISADGQKIINLARGAELANRLPDATADRKAFDAALARAQEDIKRITSLFGGALNPLSTAQLGAQPAARPSPTDGNQGASGLAGLEGDAAAALKRAFNDIRRISADVGQALQQRQSET